MTIAVFATVVVAGAVGSAQPAQAQSMINVALGRPATQSTTAFGAAASRAVDGSTDGVFNNGSVTHTEDRSESWWQVDLGAATSVDSITLFNRTDCCQSRLRNFYVFVSPTDLTGRSLSNIVADNSVQRVRITDAVGASRTLPGPFNGRFVRVQLTGRGILSLAEVQVNRASQVPVLSGDQWHRVGEQISLAVNWPATAQVVGLPPGLVFANGVVSGSVAVKGRWPVEVRTPASTQYFQWVITDGPPAGTVAEHLPVDPNTVSARPARGMDGVVWTRGNPDSTASLDVTVWDLQQVGPYMYVGGEFRQVIEQVGNVQHPQAFLARFSVDTGKWDPTFRPVLDGNVHALEVNARGLLLVGGEFTNIDGQPGTIGLAAINPATGQVDPSFAASVERSFSPGDRAIVRELEVVGSYLYIGGHFSHVNGPGGTRVRVHKAARVGADYGTIDPTWLPRIDGGSVWGIGVDQERGRVHLAGRFTSANGNTANARYVVVTTETGATVTGLAPRPINDTRQQDVYDAEYAGGRAVLAGSQHSLVSLNADTHVLDFWQFTGNSCTSSYCWSGAGVGGDFQFVEKVGNYVFAGCHCNDPVDNSGRPNHYSSVTNQRTRHRVAIAYGLDGRPVPTEFDLGGNIDGGWTVATDDTGCIWFGGDIVDGGFYEPGGRVFARGFARFCGDPIGVEAPQGLTVATAAPDGVVLEWQPVTGATGYQISRDGEQIGAIDSGSVTRYTDANVSLGGSYEYEVRAVNRQGTTSDPASVTAVVGFVDTEAPTVPSNLTAVDAGNGSVQLSWTASTDNVGILSYLVYRDGAYIGFTAPDVTTYTEVAPAVGVPYTYTVRAVDVNENRSELTNPGATITIGGPDLEPPTVPANLVAVDAGNRSVQLTWTASTDNVGILSYLVYRNGAYIGWTAPAVTTYTDVAPAVGVPYTYTVRAVDVNDNRSALTNPGATITVGGADLEPPTVPSNLVAVDAGNGSVQLTWTASTDNVGILSYLVYRNGTYVGWTAPAVTTFTEVAPAQGVPYTYTVRAVDVNDNRSALTNPGATITVGGPDLEPPTTPVNLILVNPAAGATEFLWDPSRDNVGVLSYLVYRNGAYIGWTPAGTTTFIDRTSVAGQTNLYEVRATDASGNRSPKSTPFSIAIQ